MVYTERAETAAVSRGTSHLVRTKQHCLYTTWVDIFKTRYKKLVAHLESHATRLSAVSLLESEE